MKINKQIERLNNLRKAAALIKARERHDDSLSYLVDTYMNAVKPLFKEAVLEIEDEDGEPLCVRCPVTKKVIRKKGDYDMPTFYDSPACIAEWDDVEVDCALMHDPELKIPWEDFLANLPDYEDYEDLIGKFIVANHELFEGRKLILVTYEARGGGCVSHTVDCYALLDANYANRPAPDITRLAAQASDLLSASASELQRRLLQRLQWEKWTSFTPVS